MERIPLGRKGPATTTNRAVLQSKMVSLQWASAVAKSVWRDWYGKQMYTIYSSVPGTFYDVLYGTNPDDLVIAASYVLEVLGAIKMEAWQARSKAPSTRAYRHEFTGLMRWVVQYMLEERAKISTRKGYRPLTPQLFQTILNCAVSIVSTRADRVERPVLERIVEQSEVGFALPPVEHMMRYVGTIVSAVPAMDIVSMVEPEQGSPFIWQVLLSQKELPNVTKLVFDPLRARDPSASLIYRPLLSLPSDRELCVVAPSFVSYWLTSWLFDLALQRDPALKVYDEVRVGAVERSVFNRMRKVLSTTEELSAARQAELALGKKNVRNGVKRIKGTDQTWNVENECGEIDVLAYDATTERLYVMEVKYNDLGKDIGSHDKAFAESYARQLERKVSWVETHPEAIRQSFPSCEGDPSVKGLLITHHYISLQGSSAVKFPIIATTDLWDYLRTS